MAKKRTGEPWMPADEYGRSLPALTVNLLVRDVERSAAFCRDVLGAEVRYSDVDFAAMRVAGVDFMLHADHTYEDHAWHSRLVSGEARAGGGDPAVRGRSGCR
jgi:catechol 2,3-dioxygenase-like lactoylglutathione lyase family enzyme